MENQSRLSLLNQTVSYEMLVNTPSRKDGISESTEFDLRCYGCRIIQNAGILLRLPQVVMSSAMVLFQRMYFVTSFKQLGIKETALGALFLATKTEESLRKIKSIICTVDSFIRYDFGLEEKEMDIHGTEFLDAKNSMFRAELLLLRGLGFNVQVQHAYGLAVNYLQSVGLIDEDGLLQLAWNYLNDAYYSIVYVVFQPSIIACAAIYLAEKKHSPKASILPRCWYEVFDCTEVELLLASKMILDIYASIDFNDIKQKAYLRQYL